MTARDMTAGIVTTMLRGPTTVGASVNTASIDMSTHSHALFEVTATVTTGKALAVTLQDSDDNSSFAAVAAMPTMNFAENAASVVQTMLVGSNRTRRYVRLNLAGTSSPATNATATQFNAKTDRYSNPTQTLL